MKQFYPKNDLISYALFVGPEMIMPHQDLDLVCFQFICSQSQHMWSSVKLIVAKAVRSFTGFMNLIICGVPCLQAFESKTVGYDL